MNFGNMFRAASVALTLLVLPLAALAPKAAAQTVTQQPQFTASRTVTDIGNGPVEFRMLSGNMAIFTSQSSGVGSTSGSSTALTLAATPTTLPCVGCIISGNGITSGTTVSAIGGGNTQLTLSAAMTVPAGTAVAWGAACPAAPPTAGVALVQAAVGADLPMYTQARVCTYGGNGPGGQYLTFAIGAH